ncbi:exodeoxyribonuclease VII small subunit [Lapillicoccus jejuensis]|uniref:Exodeoxyribonuclease 7 small subunit n=1 Tax=Lapillicoccus jejuensis TaxID=402171 RepID=A0A542DWD8_9MICO|nr:exodeoxyribonuclease VII small subunit [Lapillicoccus jejuensis]TQJ07413.1 exodeoxyribonuclease VII small subunit [Lapillicoccus jejuensis]
MTPPPPPTSRRAAARSTGPLAEPAAEELADVAGLGYEQARDELARIVAGLEGGQVPLEESMRLWRRGEALAAHCTAWLDGAQRQVEAATTGTPPDGDDAEDDDPDDDPDDDAEDDADDAGGDEA